MQFQSALLLIALVLCSLAHALPRRSRRVGSLVRDSIIHERDQASGGLEKREETSPMSEGGLTSNVVDAQTTCPETEESGGVFSGIASLFFSIPAGIFNMVTSLFGSTFGSDKTDVQEPCEDSGIFGSFLQ